MKKIFCLLTVSLLVLTSCSNEEEFPTTAPLVIHEDVYLKKTIEMDMDSVFVTTNYTYDGNKLVKAICNDTIAMDVYVTYTGDLITEMIYKRRDSIKQTTHYEYDFDNKLVSFIKLNPVDSLGYKEIYTYNALTGTISIASYTGDLETQTTPKGNGGAAFLNGEVTQLYTNYSPNYVYTYDTQKNPMRNVLGMAKISFTDTEAKGVLKNIATRSNNGSNLISYLYTYNPNLYPLTCTQTTTGGATIFETQYFYE